MSTSDTAAITVTIRTRPKWWVTPAMYLFGKYCKMVRREVKPETIDWFVNHGFTMEKIK